MPLICSLHFYMGRRPYLHKNPSQIIFSPPGMEFILSIKNRKFSEDSLKILEKIDKLRKETENSVRSDPSPLDEDQTKEIVSELDQIDSEFVPQIFETPNTSSAVNVNFPFDERLLECNEFPYETHQNTERNPFLFPLPKNENEEKSGDLSWLDESDSDFDLDFNCYFI